MAVFALAVPQLYLLPRGTIDIPLSTIVTILLAPTVAVWSFRHSAARPLLRSMLMYSLVGLLVARLVAVTWSPDVSSARMPVVVLGQFLVTLVLLYVAVREEPDLLDRIQYAYWPLVMLEAFMVALFRISPGIEKAYLHSIAGLFGGQNTVGVLFDVSRNNVLAPDKAGGVFVNANVAGLFLGASAMAAFAVWSRTRRRFVLVAGCVSLAGVWFTGSKAGLIFSIVLPLAALTAYGSLRLSRVLRRYLLIGGTVAVVGTVVLLAFGRGGFAATVQAAFGQRSDIWGYGAEAFGEHRVLGLGWGGWARGFATYARVHGVYDPKFPPHNVLLAAWANTGLPGLALTILFFGAMLALAVKRFRREPLFVAWTGAAFVWMIVQAMGENTDVFGEIHLIPVVALLLCCLVQLPGEEADGVTEADIWNRETSAFPALRDVHREPGYGDAGVPTIVHHTGPGGWDPGQR